MYCVMTESFTHEYISELSFILDPRLVVIAAPAVRTAKISPIISLARAASTAGR
jgi:hypothetical protein